MMKSYTLSYFFNTYMEGQIQPRIDFKSQEEDSMLHQLSEISFSPSEKSVQKILNFSKSYEVLNSRLTNCIEIIKN